MYHPSETLEPVNCILDGRLYLGNRFAAASLGLLRSLGVTHVVNAAVELPNHFPGELSYYRCNLYDNLSERVEFDGPVGFIHAALAQGGVVFVHCAAGVSRSASVVIAYLMRAYGLGMRDAIRRVEDRRPMINPNRNYLRQLELLDRATAARMPAPRWNFGWNTMSFPRSAILAMA